MAGTSRSRIATARTSRRLLCLLIALLALAACTSKAGDHATPRTAASTTNPEAIRASIDAFFANDFADAFRNRRALLLSVAGEVIVRDYYHSDPVTTINVQSVGKSIMSTLIGMALADGDLKGLDQTLEVLLPDDVSDMSAATKQVTLEQLLTMTAGLPTDDVFFPQLAEQPDWVRFILASGPKAAPTGEFAYSGAGSHLLSAILQRATGMTTLEYARKKLFDPLGISTAPETSVTATPATLPANDAADAFVWPTDPQGVYSGAGGLKLTANDMLELGTLWLAQGRWGDKELVPATWMQEATQSHVPTGFDRPTGYGYQFWITDADGHPAFAAFGLGGQLIEVVPEIELVVVVQSTSPSDPRQPVDPGTASSDDYTDLVDLIIAPEVGSP